MKTLLLLLLSLSLTNCTQSKQQRNSESEIHVPATTPDSHTSRNSLDWSGTYNGTLPCGSCNAIKMTINLYYDGTYEQTNVYQQGGKSEAVITSGTFTWNEDGNTITLINAEKPNQFFVGENYLTKLDMNGDRITGDLAEKYILRRK